MPAQQPSRCVGSAEDSDEGLEPRRARRARRRCYRGRGSRADDRPPDPGSRGPGRAGPSGAPPRLAGLRAVRVGPRRAEARQPDRSRLAPRVPPHDARGRPGHAAPDGPEGRGRPREGADPREALLRQGHLGQELRDHDPHPRRPALRASGDRRSAPAAARGRPGNAAPAGVRLADRHALHVRQPQDRQDVRSAIEPGGDRNAAARVRHALEADRKARLLRQGEEGPGRALRASLGARSRRRGDRRRNGAVVEPREPRRRRDRLVLRVPAQVRAALRRPRLRADVGGEPRGAERASRRRGALGPLVRPGGHDDRQADGDRVRRASRVPAGRSGARGRPDSRAPPAGVVLQDVEPPRHRARAPRLPEDARRVPRLPAASRDHRVGLLPSSVHEGPAVPRHGPDVLRSPSARTAARTRATRC